MDRKVWEKFDTTMDLDIIKEQLNRASANDVPSGDYEVGIEKLELVETTTKKPMLVCWMGILDPLDFNERLICYTQEMNSGDGVYKACKFLESLQTEVDINFENFTNFNEVLNQVMEKAYLKIVHLVHISKQITKNVTVVGAMRLKGDSKESPFP